MRWIKRSALTYAECGRAGRGGQAKNPGQKPGTVSANPDSLRTGPPLPPVPATSPPFPLRTNAIPPSAPFPRSTIEPA